MACLVGWYVCLTTCINTKLICWDYIQTVKSYIQCKEYTQCNYTSHLHWKKKWKKKLLTKQKGKKKPTQKTRIIQQTLICIVFCMIWSFPYMHRWTKLQTLKEVPQIWLDSVICTSKSIPSKCKCFKNKTKNLTLDSARSLRLKDVQTPRAMAVSGF